MAGKKEKAGRGAVMAVLRGTAVGAAAVLALMLLTALLVSCNVLELTESRGIGLLIGFIGGLAAGHTAMRQGRGRRILMSVAPGVILCLILLLLSAVLYEPTQAGNRATVLLCILVGGLAASAIRAHRSGRGRRTSRALHRRHKLG